MYGLPKFIPKVHETGFIVNAPKSECAPRVCTLENIEAVAEGGSGFNSIWGSENPQVILQSLCIHYEKLFGTACSADTSLAHTPLKIWTVLPLPSMDDNQYFVRALYDIDVTDVWFCVTCNNRFIESNV